MLYVTLCSVCCIANIRCLVAIHSTQIWSSSGWCLEKLQEAHWAIRYRLNAKILNKNYLAISEKIFCIRFSRRVLQAMVQNKKINCEISTLPFAFVTGYNTPLLFISHLIGSAWELKCCAAFILSQKWSSRSWKQGEKLVVNFAIYLWNESRLDCTNIKKQGLSKTMTTKQNINTW